MFAFDRQRKIGLRRNVNFNLNDVKERQEFSANIYTLSYGVNLLHFDDLEKSLMLHSMRLRELER